MLDQVLGGLGLGVVLDVVHLDDGAGVHLLAGGRQGLGLGGAELVADVLVRGRVDVGLDGDLGRVVVYPGGGVLGVGVLGHLLAVLVVLDRVVGGLGLAVVLEPLRIQYIFTRSQNILGSCGVTSALAVRLRIPFVEYITGFAKSALSDENRLSDFALGFSS